MPTTESTSVPHVRGVMPVRNRPMHALKLKIPRVALVIIFALSMWVVSVFAPALKFRLPLGQVLSLALLAGGVGITIVGVVSFARAETTVNPNVMLMNEPRTL